MVSKCAQCAKLAEQVYSATTKAAVGWYRSHCGHYEKAIGRERKFPLKHER